MKLFNMNLRKMVGINQGRERSDVLLAIVLPAVLMLVSAYTNAWAFTGGELNFDVPHLVNSLDAVFRGLFVEALVFSSFLLVRVLCSKGWKAAFSAIVPALVGLVGVAVSAGCGLAWVAKSGQMDWMIHTVSAYLPSWLTNLFQSGLGLLFPVALGVYALYDVRHLIHEHVERGVQLGTLAVQVESTEHHQNMLREAQQTADERMKGYYDQIAQENAQRAVDAAKSGDLTFGFNGTKTQQLQQRASVIPLTPLAQTRQLNAPAPAPASLPQPQQSPINAQWGPAPMMHSGNTQNIQMPPPVLPNNGLSPLPPNPNLGQGGMPPNYPNNPYR